MAADFITNIRTTLADPLCPGSSDPDQDALFSTSEIYCAATIAQDLILDEPGLQIRDSRTAITRDSVTANNPWVPWDERVLEIERATLTNECGTCVLQVVDWQTIHTHDCYGRYFLNNDNWDKAEAPLPRLLIQNLDDCSLRLYPIPTIPGQLQYTLRRGALHGIDATHDPEVPKYLMLALQYATIFHLFQTTDVDENEGSDLTKARFFKQLYDEQIDRAKRIVNRRRTPEPQVTTYGGL